MNDMWDIEDIQDTLMAYGLTDESYKKIRRIIESDQKYKIAIKKENEK